MRFLRRSLVGLFLVSLTVALLGWAGFSMQSAIRARMAEDARPGIARERAFAVNVLAITAGTEIPVLESFGEVRSKRTLELRASSGGTIVELAPDFEEGGAVEKGALLVRIDPTDAQATLDLARADLAEAEAKVEDAARTLEIARDDLTSAQAQATLRASALERQRNLKSRGVATDASVETAELAAATAGQSVLSKRQALANTQAASDQAQTALLRSRIALQNAERALSETKITASFAGSLADINAVEGGIVTANEHLASLIDPSALEVSFRVSTQAHARLLDENGVLLRGPVTASMDIAGVDLEAKGRISRESASVVSGQTGRLLFAGLEDAGGFRPGDFVTVQIKEPPLAGVARLPATAVDAAGTILVIGAEERLEQASVEVLRRLGDEVLIRATSDLVGREVVGERTPLLGAGIKVRPLRADGANAPEAAPEGLELTDERRAALITFVTENKRMPAEMKERLLAELSKERVSPRMVARLEERMGG
ncbi:MAG: multidrug efflux pump subunit AcrA (membrane-fusion protein) [Halocynthiibacter sp.]|jgi:multidrug efflux pump subunit AcrA (membrane-fusion protein)